MNAKIEPKRVACSECGNMVLPATAQRTGGKCMPCHNRQEREREQERLTARYKTGDEQVDNYQTEYYGAPVDPDLRSKAVAGFKKFIMFLQANGLTRRVILEPGAEPNKQTEVWTSDLTDEGKKLVETAHMKWLQARAGGADPEDMSLFSAALAKIRGQPQKASNSTRTLAGKGKKLGKAFSPSVQKRAGKGAKHRAANSGGSSLPPFTWNKELEKEWKESGPHVYDKAKWHYEGDYPEGLPTEQAFVHTGMFIGWLIEHDMIEEDFLPEADQFKRQEITGAGAYEIWDGVLADDMLTEEGNQFARVYYGEAFADDYTEMLVGKLPSFYHVKDKWKNYRALKTRIDERYQAWKAKSQPGRK